MGRGPLLLENHFHIRHIENDVQGAERSRILPRRVRGEKSFLCVFFFFLSHFHFSNLSLWDNHTFNELKWCNYEIGTAIIPPGNYRVGEIWWLKASGGERGRERGRRVLTTSLWFLRLSSKKKIREKHLLKFSGEETHSYCFTLLPPVVIVITSAQKKLFTLIDEHVYVHNICICWLDAHQRVNQ